MLLFTLVLLVTLLGALSYALFGYKQAISTPYQMAQLPADVRTMMAAISYLLDPESDQPVESRVSGWNLEFHGPAITETPITNHSTSG